MQLQLLENPQTFDAVAFNMDVEKWSSLRLENIHAAYRLDINEFRGQRNLQLIIEHIEPI